MPDKYNIDMTLGDLLEDEVSGKFLRENLKQLVESPQAQNGNGF